VELSLVVVVVGIKVVEVVEGHNEGWKVESTVVLLGLQVCWIGVVSFHILATLETYHHQVLRVNIREG